ncbi:hypothetical protein DL98DRAFT_525203 [Cadophora sp. DSE1049]|nr:hypothetical protein DL98DRAFT_525203 [Cadophora sp. DSE1049]
MAKSNDEHRLEGETDSDRALRHEFEKACRIESDKIRDELLRKHELLRQASQNAQNSALQNQYGYFVPTENQYSQAPVQQIGPAQTLNPDRFRYSQMLAEQTGHASTFNPTTRLQYTRMTAQQIGAANAFTPTGGLQYPRMSAQQIGAANAFHPTYGQDPRTPARQIGPAPDFTPGYLNPNAGPWYPPPPGPNPALQTDMAWSKDPAYIALRNSMGWNQGPPYIDPEWYDEKNHHRFDGDLFIPKGLFNNVPVIATPVAVRKASPWAIAPAARKDSYTGKYGVIHWWCKAHAPASDWRFNKRTSFPPRKDMDWRELFRDMTGVPFEIMDDRWVSAQSHWVRASASAEVLRRGWPVNKRKYRECDK